MPTQPEQPTRTSSDPELLGPSWHSLGPGDVAAAQSKPPRVGLRAERRLRGEPNAPRPPGPGKKGQVEEANPIDLN